MKRFFSLKKPFFFVGIGVMLLAIIILVNGEAVYATDVTQIIDENTPGLSEEEFKVYAAEMDRKYGGDGIAVTHTKEGSGNEAIYATDVTQIIDENTPGLSEEEFKAYVEKMRQKYGNAGVWGIEPEVQISASLPDHTTNLTYINSWTMHVETTNDEGRVLASSDNIVALYKLKNITDENGREHYFYWQWSSAQNRQNTGSLGDDSNLRNFWNQVDLADSRYDMLVYDPDSDITGNQKTVTVKLSASYQGVSAEISGAFVLHEDVVRPKPGQCVVGSGGKYTVEWYGNYEGTQSLNGACEERRPYGSGYNFVHRCHLEASQI